MTRFCRLLFSFGFFTLTSLGVVLQVSCSYFFISEVKASRQIDLVPGSGISKKKIDKGRGIKSIFTKNKDISNI